MSNSQHTFQLLKTLWSDLSVRRRRQLRYLCVFVTFTSFAEMLNVGAVLPFLAVLMAPAQIFNCAWFQSWNSWLGYTNPHQLLLPITALFVSIILFAGAMRLALLWMNTRLSFAIGTEIGNEIYHRTLYQPYITHVNRHSSEIIDGIASKVSHVIHNILLPALTLLSVVAILIAILGALLFINPLITLLSFGGFGLIYGVLIVLTRSRLSNNSQHIATESVKVVKILQEGLGGIRDIILDGSQATYSDAYRNADVVMRKAQGSNAFISNSPRYAVESLSMILIAIFAYFFVQRSDGVEYGIPLLATIALGAQRLLPLLQQMYAAWTTIQGGRDSMFATIEFLRQPLSEFSQQSNIAPIPFQHDIHLNQLSFRYNAETPWVLNTLNLKIPKSSRVGFIGVTGSGKSTLLDIIMGLLTPTDGVLTVDGLPITLENCRAWQSHIAHVPQHIYLSDSSILENIAFGVPKDRIDISRVQEAARQAQIAPFIESYPTGYETMVGEGGIRLSGGQKQRIGIARALYKQADVIIFDEATSALDNETERSVMQTIEALDGNITILMIAHRLTTLRGCSHIVELCNGAISRVSNYQDMMRNLETA